MISRRAAMWYLISRLISQYCIDDADRVGAHSPKMFLELRYRASDNT